jgi:hypothetical protein
MTPDAVGQGRMRAGGQQGHVNGLPRSAGPSGWHQMRPQIRAESLFPPLD